MKLVIEFELPEPVIGRFAEPFLRKLNEREAETTLANLKDLLEVVY